MTVRPLFCLALVVAAAGCGASDPANPDPRCQPTAPAGTCFLPFPSSFYLAADMTSATGFRVAVPQGILPKNQVDADFDVTRLNQLDGWSASSQLVVDLGARVDPARLPKQGENLAPSMTAPSAVQLLSFPDGQ